MVCSTSAYWTCQLGFEWSAQMERVLFMDLLLNLDKINLTARCFRLCRCRVQGKKNHLVVSQVDAHLQVALVSRLSLY